MPLLFCLLKIMILHKVLKRGSDHPVFCQDAIAIGETERSLYFCVFDGCSGGKDSHFASALFSKAFNDTIINLSSTLNNADINLENNSKFIIYMMARKISEIKHVLHLNTIELLTTMIMCSIDKETRECIICAFGDGYLSVDGNEHIIKNTKFLDKENGDNMPDYMAYDIDSIEAYGDFDIWFSQKSEIHKFENVKDVSIASDGICTFKNFKPCGEIVNPIDFLIKDESLMATKNMLERKHNILNSKFYMTNTDDLSVIRIKFE